MNNEQIRIAISKSLGWTELLPEGDGWLWGVNPAEKFNECGGWMVVPDYCNSLDACADFERALTEEELDKYASTLVFLRKTGEPRVFSSPPLRRSIAYLRVRGLWAGLRSESAEPSTASVASGSEPKLNPTNHIIP